MILDCDNRVAMSAYFQLTRGFLERPLHSLVADGESLVDQCLNELVTDVLPPQLLILWITPAFADRYRLLVEAIHSRLIERGLGAVPLVGSTVAACIYGDRVHKDGALLCCLSSRFLEARVAYADRVVEAPADAARQLVKKLADPGGGASNLGQNDRLLITFFSGYDAKGQIGGYRANEIVAALRQEFGMSLSMFGGVSSEGLTERGPGRQFANDTIISGGVAAALLTSAVMHAVRISHGLKSTGEVLTVKKMTDDGRTIVSFEEGEAVSVFKERLENRVLAPAPWQQAEVVVPKIEQGCLRVPRPLVEGTKLEILHADAALMARSVAQTREKIRRDLGVGVSIKEAPAAGILGVACVARYREGPMDVAKVLQQSHDIFRDTAYAGCYLEGEVGVGRDRARLTRNVSRVFSSEVGHAGGQQAKRR